MLVDLFFKDILCEEAPLLETIYALFYFDVDCTAIVSQVVEVVGFDKIGREVTDFHAHVFWSAHGCVEVENFQINGAVACILCWYDAVEMELDSDHVGGRCAAVPRVVKVITVHSDSCAVGVLLSGQ